MPKGRRLFFALWPDDELRGRIESELQLVVRESRGRPASLQNLHITVLFVGEVFEPQLPFVLAAGATAGVPSFTLTLDRIETLSPSNVLCLEASQTPPALADLVRHLRFSLLAQQIKLKEQKLRPHLTLARKLPRAISLRPTTKYEWHVGEFVLAESALTPSGSQYSIIGRWPLDAAKS